MEQVTLIGAALSDPGRVRVLMSLVPGELCVCQVVELLGLAPSTISRHLSVLKDAGLIHTRKQGRWIYCRLPDESALPVVRRALKWVTDELTGDASISADRSRLDAICCMGKEELCRKQAGKSACCSSAPETRAGARWQKGSRGRSRGTRSKPTRPVSTRTG